MSGYRAIIISYVNSVLIMCVLIKPKCLQKNTIWEQRSNNTDEMVCFLDCLALRCLLIYFFNFKDTINWGKLKFVVKKQKYYIS